MIESTETKPTGVKVAFCILLALGILATKTLIGSPVSTLLVAPVAYLHALFTAIIYLVLAFGLWGRHRRLWLPTILYSLVMALISGIGDPAGLVLNTAVFYLLTQSSLGNYFTTDLNTRGEHRQEFLLLRRVISRIGLVIIAPVVIMITTGLMMYFRAYPTPAAVWIVLIGYIHYTTGFLSAALITWKVVEAYRIYRPSLSVADHRLLPMFSRLTWPLLVLAIVTYVTGIPLLLRFYPVMSYALYLDLHLWAGVIAIVFASWHLYRYIGSARRNSEIHLRRLAIPESREFDPNRRSLLKFVGAASVAIALGAKFSDFLEYLETYSTGQDSSTFPVTFNGDTDTQVDIKTWQLQVVKDATELSQFSYRDLQNMPMEEKDVVLGCVSGWFATVRWRGVSLATILSKAGASLDFATARFESVTGYAWTHSRETIMQPDTMLAVSAANGVLSSEHGFPARLVAPGRPGEEWVKYVKRIVIE